MFGVPGHAYVYLSHGVWYCMNVVAHDEGVAGAVLLRGAEPLAGTGEDASRLAGPGLLGRAFGLTTAHTGLDLVRSPLHLRDAPPVRPRDVLRGVRVGIAPSTTSGRPWRFWIGGSRGVSRR
jgi:DNA-3-methyladenine glycosylase